MFYADTVAAYAHSGRWWPMGKHKKEPFQDEVLRRLAGGIDASFLIPALADTSVQLEDLHGGSSGSF